MAATSSPPGVGLLKGLGVTVKQMFKPAVTQQYPHVRPELAPRTRGVIALMDENCTVCMLCARECPDWCIYIDSHKETVPPAKEGGRARTRNVLDRFAIDFALCMYCGICVEVCPFDALFWSPEFEYSEYDIGSLLHEKEKLREWMDTVPPPPALDEGAEAPPEVGTAIEKANQELEAAKAKAEEQARAKEAGDAPAAGGDAGGGKAAAEPEVKAGEIDQETYDQLIAEGKSERIARSKAKAAFVKKEKARLKAEAEAAGGDEPAADAGGDAPAETAEAGDAGGDQAPAAPRKGDIQVEGAGEIDQETYDALIAEGKSERIARAKAKAAWVRKKKQEQIDAEGGE
jgi:NADH-quinone oxidoreductase subunit I